MQPTSRFVRHALCTAVAGCWALAEWQADGAQYYAAAGGNNGNPGSAAAPWATLQYAANRVGAGDRVVVRPGQYAGFDMDASGTAPLPIEFFAEPGVLITEENARTPDGINLEGSSHVIIDGFAVTGMERAGVRSVLGDHVTIRNVHAYDNGVWGIFTGFVDDLLVENNETSGSIAEHGIYVSNSGDRPVLRGNKSWGNHGSGIHMNGDESQGGDGIISEALVTGNMIYDNAKPVGGGPLGGGSGINMDGVQNSRIENNLLYGNRASGISLYSIDGAEGSTGNEVVNNTIHQPSNGRWAINIRDESTDNTLLNNILVTQHSYRGAISIWEDSLDGLASDYNVLVSRFTTDDGDTIQDLDQWQASTGQDVHSRVASAADLFVNWQAFDYALKPGAAAIDAGASNALGAPAPPVDLLDRPRPQGSGFDAGALERPTLAGDFDGSGTVNAADLAAWKAAFVAGARSGADLLVWQRRLGMPSATSAPEPTSGALLMTLVGVSVGALRHGVCRSAFR